MVYVSNECQIDAGFLSTLNMFQDWTLNSNADKVKAMIDAGSQGHDKRQGAWHIGDICQCQAGHAEAGLRSQDYGFIYSSRTVVKHKGDLWAGEADLEMQEQQDS